MIFLRVVFADGALRRKAQTELVAFETVEWSVEWAVRERGEARHAQDLCRRRY